MQQPESFIQSNYIEEKQSDPLPKLGEPSSFNRYKFNIPSFQFIFKKKKNKKNIDDASAHKTTNIATKALKRPDRRDVLTSNQKGNHR